MARYEKVAVALKKEISSIIHDEIKDPRLGFVTITRVELTPDLRFAKVFFSVLGKEEDYTKTKEALGSSLGFIRRLISQRIRLRFTPEISFREDHSNEYSLKIEKILNEIKEQDASRIPAEKTAVKNKKGKVNGTKKNNRSNKKA